MLPSVDGFAQTVLWIALQVQALICHLIRLGVSVAESCRRFALDWRWFIVAGDAILTVGVSAFIASYYAVRRWLLNDGFCGRGPKKMEVQKSFYTKHCVFVFVWFGGVFCLCGCGLYIGR